MRILVTGGAGFIGSAVVRMLMRAVGAEVVVIDKLTYAASLTSLASVSSMSGYHFVHQDICDFDPVFKVFLDFSPDAVMHLAAESHVDRSITGSAEFIRTNVVGTHVMLEAARGYWAGLPTSRKDAFRFLHVSTDEVYGSLGADGAFSEVTAYDPSSPYSASKAASDHLVMAWYRTFGLPIVLSNCSNNYGPYHFPEKLIPLTIINALENRPVSVYGDGSNVRDWLYVDDHAKALLAILLHGRIGEKYNVGGRSERTNIDVVNAVCDMVDDIAGCANRRNLVQFVVDRPGHDHRYAIDSSKLERELGWKAEETFESGLRKTVGWFLENQAWWEPLRKSTYSGERLGVLSPR